LQSPRVVDLCFANVDIVNSFITFVQVKVHNHLAQSPSIVQVCTANPKMINT
uniref:Uncharacterized protein n=1 Tax=Periophthalmus magnuspinnatus TaxID=409849 RepID=A0A3B3ZIJ1_9GOBI